MRPGRLRLRCHLSSETSERRCACRDGEIVDRRQHNDRGTLIHMLRRADVPCGAALAMTLKRGRRTRRLITAQHACSVTARVGQRRTRWIAPPATCRADEANDNGFLLSPIIVATGIFPCTTWTVVPTPAPPCSLLSDGQNQHVPGRTADLRDPALSR